MMHALILEYSVSAPKTLILISIDRETVYECICKDLISFNEITKIPSTRAYKNH